MNCMKIFLAASSSFWDRLPEMKEKLEKLGHEVRLSSTVDDPELEEKTWQESDEAHVKLIRKLFEDSEKEWVSGVMRFIY